MSLLTFNQAFEIMQNIGNLIYNDDDDGIINTYITECNDEYQDQGCIFRVLYYYISFNSYLSLEDEFGIPFCLFFNRPDDKN